MKLNELRPAKGATRNRKRLGRGPGSGHGTTAGKGYKGQKARSGGGVRPGFEGGQMPIHRRLPKRGFTNIFKKNAEVINLRDLARFESGSVIDVEALKNAGLVKGRNKRIKLLAHGEIGHPISVKGIVVSGQAKAKIQAAGGQVEDI